MAIYRRVLSFAFPSEALTRDILLICLSNVIGAFGEGLYSWVFPLYVRSLQADYLQLGIVLSTVIGFAALVPLPGGLLADRFDRKKILILSWTPWVLAPFIYSFATNWTQLIPGTFCFGVSMIGIPAVNAYVVTAVPNKKTLTQALSLIWSSYFFSYIFAPATGGFLATIIGMRWVFRTAGILCAIATSVFFFIHSQHPHMENEMEPEATLSKTEEKRLWRKIIIWSAFLAAAFFFINIGRPYVQTFLSESVKMSELQVGLFGSISFAGMTFIGIGVSRMGDRWKKSGAMGICLLLYAISIIPLMLTNNIGFLMFIAFFLGGSAASNTLTSSYAAAIAPKSKRGLWLSIPQTAILISSFIAPYLGAYLYTFSPTYAFTISITAMPILVGYAILRLKD
jgi:DHA1 family multidrug resistance protein-like MFS transporter